MKLLRFAVCFHRRIHTFSANFTDREIQINFKDGKVLN